MSNNDDAKKKEIPEIPFQEGFIPVAPKDKDEESPILHG